MPERNQMIRGRPDPARVIAEHGARLERLGQLAIDENDGYRNAAQLLHRRLVILVREREQEPVDSALTEETDVRRVERRHPSEFVSSIE